MSERDTVILADVTVGNGGSSVKVSKQYCVIDTHEKYYSKWFMAKVRQEIFGKDFKYKLKVYDAWRRGERPRLKDRGPKYVRALSRLRHSRPFPF